MRIITIALIATSLAAPAVGLEMPTGFVQIGEFSVQMEGENQMLVSAFHEGREESDLYYSDYQDQNGRTVRGYTIQSSADIYDDKKTAPPVLLVEFTSDPGTRALIASRIILVDQGWDTPLATYRQITEKPIEITNYEFNENGEISFAVRAVLLRLNWDSYKPVAGAKPIEIQARYTGKFPAIALEYPRIFGDY